MLKSQGERSLFALRVKPYTMSQYINGKLYQRIPSIRESGCLIAMTATENQKSKTFFKIPIMFLSFKT